MKTILVPLDGSEHSDHILPMIYSLLAGAKREAYLLRVVPPFEPQAGSVGAELPAHDDPHLSLRVDAARRHLESLVEQLEAHGVEVTSEVFLGEPTETILLTAKRIRASLIALVTHGRTGIGRWFRGSVAESILRSSTVPLLLFNSAEGGVRPTGLPLCGRILVALDGSDRSAAVLPAVADLASQLRAEVTLLRCLRTIPPTMDPGIPPISVQHAQLFAGPTEADASKQLEPHRETLARRGISTRIRVDRGDPARRILAAAEDEDAGLIAMTTHGDGGVARLLFGSVAEAVLRQSPRPVLISQSANLLAATVDEQQVDEAQAYVQHS